MNYNTTKKIYRRWYKTGLLRSLSFEDQLIVALILNSQAEYMLKEKDRFINLDYNDIIFAMVRRFVGASIERCLYENAKFTIEKMPENYKDIKDYVVFESCPIIPNPSIGYLGLDMSIEVCHIISEKLLMFDKFQKQHILFRAIYFEKQEITEKYNLIFRGKIVESV